MSNQLHQMTVSYDATEDRMLFRTNTTGGEEYRLWLTRRYVQLLMTVLNKQMGQVEQVEMKKLQATPKEQRQPAQATHKIDHDKPFQEYGAEYPLATEAILVSKINVTDHEDGTVTLGLVPAQGKGVNIRMNQQIMDQTYELLVQAVAKADWRLDTVL